MKLTKDTSKSPKIQNGIRREDILHLIKEYPISVIEKAIVSIYLRRKGYSVPRNKFLREIMDKSDVKSMPKIDDYLSARNILLDLKNLEKIFELLINPSERKLNGAYYTPTCLVDYIINRTVIGDIAVCDPACGSGAFLVAATRRIAKKTGQPIVHIIERNIYGMDILPSTIERCKIILSVLAVENGEDKSHIDFNLRTGDSLQSDWKNLFPKIFKKDGFDAVVGNPPYVRSKNLTQNIRQKMQNKWSTANGGNVDLFVPFIELGIQLINYRGIAGFVLPNGYTNSFSCAKLRQFLQDNEYVKEIIDFNHLQLFEDATTYTCISLFDKTAKESFKYALIDNEKKLQKLETTETKKIEFRNIHPKNWKLLGNSERRKIRKIETIGNRLEDLAQIKTGIATLRNDLYVLISPESNGKYFLKEYNGKKYKIEKGITKPAIHAGTVKSTKQIDNDNRWIVFPYELKNGKYSIIPENYLAKHYPKCYQYFKNIKNELGKRDKGKKEYETWYAYGRSQGLETHIGKKIVIPTISNSPRFVITNKREALIYAGYGIYYDGDLQVLAKILNSAVMWYYIKKTSKRYASGYMSFAKNFIKNFSIPDLTKEEKKFIKKSSQPEVDAFLRKKYGLS